MISFLDEASRLAFMDKTELGADAFHLIPSISYYLVDLDGRWEPSTALTAWNEEPGITGIMRDFLPVYSGIPVPDGIKNQWGFQQTYIQEAQSKVTNTNQVKVGVIDGAISTTNPFLSERLIQPRQYPQINQTETAHATAVSAIIAAIAPRNATLYSYGVLVGGDPATGSDADIQQTNIFTALEDATTDGVKVVNLAVGYCNEYYMQYPDFRQFSELFHSRLLDLSNTGVTIIAAAGNGTNGTCTDSRVTIPAVWDDAIIAVGGATMTGSDIKPTSWSSQGYALDLIAPAERVMSYYPSSIQNLAGTSFAAPFATGTVTLMLAANPSLGVQRIRDILTGTTRYLDGYSFPEQGWGLLNAANAVQAASNPTPPTRQGPLTISVTGIDSLDYTIWPTIELTNLNGDHPKATTSYIFNINSSYQANYQISEIATRGKSELYVFFPAASGRTYCTINRVSSDDGGTNPPVASSFVIRQRDDISYIAGANGNDFNHFTSLLIDISCDGTPPVDPPVEPPIVPPEPASVDAPVEIVYMKGARESVNRIISLIASANQKLNAAGIKRILKVANLPIEFSPAMIKQQDGAPCLAHSVGAIRIYAGSNLDPCPMTTPPDYPAIALRSTAYPETDSAQYPLAANVFSRQIGAALGGRSLSHLKTTLTSSIYDPNTPGLMYDPAFAAFDEYDMRLINGNSNVPRTDYLLWQTLIPSPELASRIQVVFFDTGDEQMADFSVLAFGREADQALASCAPASAYSISQNDMTLLDLLPDLASGSSLWTASTGILKNEVIRFDTQHDGITTSYYFDSADLNRIFWQVHSIASSGTYSGLYLNLYAQGDISLEIMATDYVATHLPPQICLDLPAECNPDFRGPNIPPNVESWFFDGRYGSESWEGGNTSPSIRAGETKTFAVLYENNGGTAPGDIGQELYASATASAGTVSPACNGPHNDDQYWPVSFDSTGVSPGTEVTITVFVDEPGSCEKQHGSANFTILVE